MSFVCNQKIIIYVNNKTFECQKFIYNFFTIPLKSFQFDINGKDLLGYLTTEIILDNKQIHENIFFNPIISVHGQKKLDIHLKKYRKVIQPPHVLLIENNSWKWIKGICIFIVVALI